MKTRTIQRTQLVPHTINGKTQMVLDRFDVEVPVPPRDWDRTVLTAVTAAAGFIGAACIVWSTASIGDLLARATITPAAYAAAAVFDLVWLSCMALEWLARYDADRAKFPRRAGYVALAIAMVAVGAHGWIADQAAIGFVGAAVSGLAKGMWTLVLRHHAKPLDRKTQQWVDAERAEVGGRLAMVAVRRELTRAESAVAAEQAAIGATVPETPEIVRTPPEDDAETPDNAEQPPPDGPMTMTDAVRTALSCGISTPDAVVRYVRKVADVNAKEDSILRTLRMLRRAS